MGVEGLAIRLPQAKEETLKPSLAEFVDAESAGVFIPPAYNDVKWRVAIPAGPVPVSSESSSPVTPETSLPPATAAIDELPGYDLLTIAPTAGVALWVLGTLFLLARMLVQQARMSRVRAKAVAVEPGVQAACDAIAGRLGVPPPPARRSPFLSSPCLDGLIRPMILLPEEMDDDPRDALVHELAHLARRDGWWNLARRLATAALWFQPLSWVLSRRVETTAEEVCDDVAVDLGADRTRYAELLVTIAGRSLPPSSPAAVHMIGRRSPLRRRIARILDASRPLSTRAGRLAFLAVLTAGLASTALAGLLSIGNRPHPEPPARAEAPEAPDPEEPAPPKLDATHGRVVDAEGKPLAGATVIARGFQRNGSELLPVGHEVARMTTDAEGLFRVPDDVAGLGKEVTYVVKATGFRPAAPLSERLAEGVPVRMSTADPAPIEGRIVDHEGRPVAGARVRVSHAYLIDRSNLVGKMLPDLSLATRITGWAVQPEPATTDADGRFRIDGLSREDAAVLEVSAPGTVRKATTVFLRTMPRIAAAPGVGVAPAFDDGELQGTPCTITLEPSRLVEGTIRDMETNEPIPGAIVTARSISDARSLVAGHIWAQSDAQGRYRLDGLPKEGEKGHRLAVYPPLDRPYFLFLTRDGQTVPPSPGIAPTTFDIALRRGIWIEGRVVDAKSGKPVSALIDYYPMLSNPHAENRPEFPKAYTLPWQERYSTDAEGRFRVPGLPGDGVVAARCRPATDYRTGVGAEGIAHATTGNKNTLLTYGRITPQFYNTLKAVVVPDGAESFACELGVDHGRSILLRAVDEAGRPVPDVVVLGAEPNTTSNTLIVDARGETRIGGLAPGERRVVRIRQPTRKLGAIVLLDADAVPEGQPVVATLRPLGVVTGRLVDSGGKPTQGRVRLGHSATFKDGTSLGFGVGSENLDDQGRFRIEDVPPGDGYDVTASPPIQGGRPSFKSFPLGRDLKVDPGQTADLGTFNVDTGQRIEEPKTTQAQPPAAGPIQGRVTDEQNKPVADATVVAWRWRRGQGAGVGLREFLPDRRFDSRTTTTDAEGRYSMPDFDPAPEWDDQARLTLLRAAAPGHAVGASVWRSQFGPASMGRDIRLAKGDHPIVGRVLDVQGRPVAGARVRLRLMSLAQVANPVAAGRVPDASLNRPGEGAVGGPIQQALGLDGLATDADGRFRFPGLAHDAETIFEIDRPGMPPHVIRVFARPMTPVKSSFSTAEGDLEAIPDFITGDGVSRTTSGSTTSAERPEQLVYGSEFTTTLEPGRIFEGVIRDAETHRPISGVVVAASRRRTDGRDLPARITATTDAEGRYRLISPPAFDGGSPWISVHPQVDQPYFLPGAATKPPNASATYDFDLKRGRWIVGKLLDPDGRPVAGSIDYAPMAANPLATEYFGLPLRNMKFLYGYHGQRFRTAADGAYRVLGLTGPGVVLARADEPLYLVGTGAETVAREPQAPMVLATSFRTMPNDFHVMKSVDVPAGDAPFACDLAIDSGGSALLKFVDEKGEPVEATVSGRVPPTSFYGAPVRHARDVPATEVRILALARNEARPVWIRARNGGLLSAAFPVTAGSDRTVTLHWPVKVVGRLLLADGKPAKGDVQLDLAPNGRMGSTGQAHLVLELDEEGRFEHQVPVGGPYLLHAVNLTSSDPGGHSRSTSTKKVPGGLDAFYLTNALTIEPGKPINLGTFNAEAGRRIEDPEAAQQPPPAMIKGRVVDEQGKPIPGATVVAWRWRRSPVPAVSLQEYLPNRRFDSRSAKTDADGRYSMPDFEPAPEWDDQARYTRIYAAAPGYVAGATVWKSSSRGPSLSGDIQLSKKDQPILGRVVDPQGGPIAGARVKLRQAYLPQPGTPPADASLPIPGGRRRHDGGPIQEALGFGDLTTDADGRFRFSGLGYDSFAIFEILRPDLAPHLVRVVARPMQPHQRRDINLEAALHEMSDFLNKADEKPLRGSELWPELGSHQSETTLYGSDFTTTLEPSWIIEGSIRDAESREPIAGVVVAASRNQHDGRETPARITATTDAQGRYRLIAPSAYDGAGPWISTHPLVNQPYFASVPTKAKGPSGPTTWDFDLRRGRWIVGKLIDEDQGKPVAAVVDYAPAKDNPLAAAYFGQPSGMIYRNGLHRDRFQTAADGTFRVLGIPGAGFVLARTDDPSYLSSYGVKWAPALLRDPFPKPLPTAFQTDSTAYQAARPVDVPAGDAPFACDLSLSHGGSVLLKFVDEKGEPLKATVIGRVPPPPSWTGLHPTTNEPAAEVRVEKLAPGESRRVYVNSASDASAAIVKVQAGPDRVVTLHPRVLVTGKIVHGDGRPARGGVNMTVRDSEQHPATFSSYSTSDDIDETGAFHCWAVVGGPYVLYALNLTYERPNGSRGYSSEKAPGGFAGFLAAKDLTIEPGKPVDLGTFNADTGQPAEKKD